MIAIEDQDLQHDEDRNTAFVPKQKIKNQSQSFSDIDLDRIIEMAWEDRTPFEAIEAQFGLRESAVKSLMKRSMKFSSYKMWRKRVEASATKHARTRVDGIDRFKSKLQRAITLNKISKRR